MGDGFRDCVVAFVDLIGVKNKAANSEASFLMREMHAHVENAFQQANALPTISSAYTWNDSVLTVSLLSEPPQYRSVLRDIAAIRAAIATPNFAVVIKGQAFPEVDAVQHGAARLTVLKSSSWAMANCFNVEEAASAHVKVLRNENKPLPCWYIDDRLVQAVGALRLKAVDNLSVTMFPDRQQRKVWCFTSDQFQVNGD